MNITSTTDRNTEDAIKRKLYNEAMTNSGAYSEANCNTCKRIYNRQPFEKKDL